MRSLDRSALASIENGRRQRIGVDQLFALAYALDVAPLHLLLPLDDDALVQVVPSTTVPAVRARRWVRGQEQLPGRDDKRFALESPDSEVPAAVRLYRAELVQTPGASTLAKLEAAADALIKLAEANTLSGPPPTDDEAPSSASEGADDG